MSCTRICCRQARWEEQNPRPQDSILTGSPKKRKAQAVNQPKLNSLKPNQAKRGRPPKNKAKSNDKTSTQQVELPAPIPSISGTAAAAVADQHYSQTATSSKTKSEDGEWHRQKLMAVPQREAARKYCNCTMLWCLVMSLLIAYQSRVPQRFLTGEAQR